MNNSKHQRFLFAIFLFALVILFTPSCQLTRFVIYNFADINDHKKFPSRELESDNTPFKFNDAPEGRVPKKVTSPEGKEMSFDEYLEKNKTVAFLIIKEDSLIYEKYFKGYDAESIVPSFSMAKSVISILIGCAIKDGFIQSVDEKMVKYIPELAGKGMEEVTIEHLLQQTSGIAFNESYVNPFGDAAAFYYGTNLRKSISKMKPAYPPGQKFSYTSGNSQLLGLVLERALNGKTITAYLQETLWTPLEMEYDASWSIDRKKEGLEKTFCCLNARARDYAKIGRLYLNKGNWNGEQIVPEEWVARSTKIDTSNGSRSSYQYQWWIPSRDGDFEAVGILGQYIYVNPEKDMIMVRLGKNEGDVDWSDIFKSLAGMY